jgi:hypothetical protein
MDYAVLFEDNEEKAGKRAEFMKEHLAFLRSNANFSGRTDKRCEKRIISRRPVVGQCAQP